MKREVKYEIKILRKKAEEKPDKHLNPVDFLMKLDVLLPDDVILVADGGDFVGTAAYTLRFATTPTCHTLVYLFYRDIKKCFAQKHKYTACFILVSSRCIL